MPKIVPKAQARSVQKTGFIIHETDQDTPFTQHGIKKKGIVYDLPKLYVIEFPHNTLISVNIFLSLK